MPTAESFMVKSCNKKSCGKSNKKSCGKSGTPALGYVVRYGVGDIANMTSFGRTKWLTF
jgi:hypothetical protein